MVLLNSQITDQVEKSEMSETSEKVFPTFSLPTFRFWSNTQNRKLRRRKLGKKFPRFSIFLFLDYLIKCPRFKFID